ncbi:unnamed protein product [Amaranthus hypochondriacus]
MPADLAVVVVEEPLSLLLFNRQNNKNNSNSNNTNAAATDIPIIAPLDSFFPPTSAGEEGTTAIGEGDGEGKKDELHGGNGSPHSCKLPTKDVSGNFLRVSGIEPFKLLLATLKSVKSALILGI